MEGAANNKKNILARTYISYVCLCIFAICIIYRMSVIQFAQGDYWRAKADTFTTKVEDMEALRGNIFDANGNLLATSLPYYEVAMDINVPTLTDKFFNDNRDSLALCLSQVFPDRSKREFLSMLDKARREKDRYVVIRRNVSHKDLQQIRQFPIFRKGKRGGLITLQTNRRERPFQMLAARTIGMSRKDIKPVGLEGAFDSVLMGVSGKRLMQKIAGNVWRPINDENEVEPKDGSDLYTTIDINLQDVAEHALEKALIRNKAPYGCAVLMEVKTGAVRAIANLTRSKDDSTSYSESFNYALGYPSEPGSTFKLASYLALFDEYDIDLNEKVNVGNGECMYFDRKMKDSHPPKTSVMTAQEIFEQSSNVGTSKLVTKYFARNPRQFISKLNSFHLNQKLGLTIPGEGIPRIKQVRDRDWYGTSLPWLSIGYESKVTPLQTLTLYNAVANNGKMVKPMFVKEIRRNGQVVRQFETEVMSEQIVKASTVAKAKTILEGVVLHGSGKGINVNVFKVGGKTGTAQMVRNGNYKEGGVSSYQATFVGYFPADKPLYSCIVVIYQPSGLNYYGGLVAAPVFKEVAEKVYSSSVEFIEPRNAVPAKVITTPEILTTTSDDMKNAAKMAGLSVACIPESLSYVRKAKMDSTSFAVTPVNIEGQLKRGVMPNLAGLSAKDALYLLENNGVYVTLRGFGSVRKQSIEPGQKFNKGNRIILILS